MARHVVQSAVTSGTVMACGDVLCQFLQRRRDCDNSLTSTSGRGLENKQQRMDSDLSSTDYLDLRRTSRFFIVGLTLHGPMFHYALPMLHRVKFCGVQRVVGNWQNHALPKVALGHVTIFPMYTTAFLAYLGTLEGLSVDKNIERMQKRLPDLLYYGSMVWPVANVVNFAYVPLDRRLLYLNMVGVGWNAFLSFETNGINEKETTMMRNSGTNTRS